MNHAPLATCLLAAALATACQSSPERIDVSEALLANKLEIQIDGSGALTEVENHVSPDDVPAAVRAAMDRLHPGGPFSDAEREINDGVLYYELSRPVDGLEVEAMFSAEGALYSEEIEVRAEAVPQEVRAAVQARYPDGVVAKYEEIRDGSRSLYQYHVKVDVGERRHKVLLSTNGAILGDYIELPAEVEVPVGG